nr:protein BUD31 homolog isoform X2 [Equus asinus]
MPKVKRSRKAPPDGWELIEPTLDELDQKMREGADLLSSCNAALGLLCLARCCILGTQSWASPLAGMQCSLAESSTPAFCWDHRTVCGAELQILAETEPHEGKRKVESLWPIFRIHHQKTRYIFDLFYKRKAISRELYEYCIKEGYADKNLIAKWKKQGYENLCCLRCIQTRDTNFGTNCICRVPKSKLEVGRIIECTHCGCRGCSG